MVKPFWHGLLFALAATACAHAADKHGDWQAVEKLKPGKFVEVHVFGQPGLEGCTLISVDDSMLTCQRERDPNANCDAASNARIVFPRNAIASLSLIQTGHRISTLQWIGLGAVSGLLIAAYVANPLAGLWVSGVTVAVWTQAEARRPPQWPRQPQINRRLVYRAATP
jgi:hypothetical protein